MSNINKLVLNLKIEQPFGNLFREKTVLVACRTHGGKYLFGEKKNFYPNGIVRLIGGGVDKNDKTTLAAAQRELEEEIKYKPSENELSLLGIVNVLAKDNKSSVYNHKVYIYNLNLPESVFIEANDDLSGICELDINEIRSLLNTYKNLPKTLMGSEGNLNFRWYDFAQLYGPLHQFVFDSLKTNR